jgi:hypothetical protein
VADIEDEVTLAQLTVGHEDFSGETVWLRARSAFSRPAGFSFFFAFPDRPGLVYFPYS